MTEDWWMLLKGNPRSRRENKRLEEMKNQIDRNVDNEEPFDERRLQAFAQQLARDHSVARRNVDIRRPRPKKDQRRDFWTGKVTQEYEPAEDYQAQPIKSKIFDVKAGSQQPNLTAHVSQRARGGDSMREWESIDELQHPLDPRNNPHGEGTPARLDAEQVRRERRGY